MPPAHSTIQKVIEESPSPGISAATRAAMTQAAVGLAELARYRGAGTVEFVVDADSEQFFFLEMNTRIQVEHPVTEAVTGADLVSLQLRLAAAGMGAGDLPQASISQNGHAIEMRLYAKNPNRMFLPSPGTLTTLSFPQMDGLRFDTGVRQGDQITPPISTRSSPSSLSTATHANKRSSGRGAPSRQPKSAISSVISRFSTE